MGWGGSGDHQVAAALPLIRLVVVLLGSGSQFRWNGMLWAIFKGWVRSDTLHAMPGQRTRPSHQGRAEIGDLNLLWTVVGKALKGRWCLRGKGYLCLL